MSHVQGYKTDLQNGIIFKSAISGVVSGYILPGSDCLVIDL